MKDEVKGKPEEKPVDAKKASAPEESPFILYVKEIVAVADYLRENSKDNYNYGKALEMAAQLANQFDLNADSMGKAHRAKK